MAHGAAVVLLTPAPLALEPSDQQRETRRPSGAAAVQRGEQRRKEGGEGRRRSEQRVECAGGESSSNGQSALIGLGTHDRDVARSLPPPSGACAGACSPQITHISLVASARILLVAFARISPP